MFDSTGLRSGVAVKNPLTTRSALIQLQREVLFQFFRRFFDFGAPERSLRQSANGDHGQSRRDNVERTADAL
jgi:hypothetical protein